MTLAYIMTAALMELDEDPGDISEYASRFKRYVNDGYHIAVRDYLKPRSSEPLKSDKNGRVYIDGIEMERVISVYDSDGRELPWEISPDGEMVITSARNKEVWILYEKDFPMLLNDMDEPMLPEFAHSALVDYICYRHLTSGNLAKQSRAQVYLRMFYETLSRIQAEAHGSVRNFRNLYESTGL